MPMHGTTGPKIRTKDLPHQTGCSMRQFGFRQFRRPRLFDDGQPQQLLTDHGQGEAGKTAPVVQV